jgi:hypothetical protein
MTQPTSEQESEPGDAGKRFRRTLASVMTVQVITLLLLWVLQRAYTP